MKRFLVITIGLAVAAAVAYAAILAWYDGDRIRSAVSDRMLERHGVVVQIDELQRSFAPRPHIRLAGLRVANAESRDHELISIKTASFRVHPLSFLAGSIALDRILVDGVRVTVPADEGGALYWDPLVAAVSDWLHRFDWSLRDFDIRNLETERHNVSNENDLLVSAGRISGGMARPAELVMVASDVKANLETTLPLRLNRTASIKHLELGRQRGDLPVTFEVEGSVGDKLLSINAAGDNLLDGDPMERDRLRARIVLGDAVAHLHGTMSRDHLTHVDLSVMLDKPGADGGFHVEADVSDPGTRWQFSSIRASLAGSELTGDIEIGQRGERRFFGGAVAVTNVQHPEEEQQSESEATLSEVLPAGDLFSNLLDFTGQFDADFRFLAKESTLWGVPFEQLELHALLDQGALAAVVEKAYIREAALSANFNVTPQDEQTMLELNASLQDAPLAALIGGVKALDGVTGVFDGNLELRAAGEDTSSVLNSTAGRVVLFLEDGEMPDELATRLSGDLLSAMFENFDKEDTTPIRCAIVVLSVDEGIARSQQMFLDTGPVNLYGKGNIRLGEQRVDIELVPRAKDFSLVSMRLPLRFHGPFADIKFDPDVSRGVESLLTPIELGREEDSSCAAPPMSAANQ